MTNNVLVSNDSIQMVANGVLSEQYEQSQRLDTLSSRVDSIMEMTEQFGQSTQLDTILSRIETIMEYGIGYHDAAEHIALPLLIALFAFSFTFLFPAINHINNKYNSPQLSSKFSNSFQYVFYWACTVLDVITLLSYGVLSLLPSVSIHHWVTRQIWILIVVAVIYSIAIVCFVLYCIQFNKPSWLLQKDDTKDDIKWKLIQAQSIISLMNTEMVLGKSVKTVDPNFYGNMLDIYRYALNNNDMKLFDDVMDYMTKVSEAEVKALPHKSVGNYLDTSYSILLFDNAFSIYASIPDNLHVESLLVRNKLNCFSHRYLVKTIYLAQMMKMADYGHISMMDKYIELSSNAFNFIKTLPRMMYVQGKSIDRIANSELKGRESWDVVCCEHFVLTAYWFSKGHYSFLNTLINIDKYSDNALYPNSYSNILSLYAKCIQKNHGNRLKACDLVEGVVKVVNTDMVKRYTTALLMLTNNEKHNYNPMVRKDFLIFDKEKESFVACCDELKKDNAFSNQFPQIKNVDSPKLIEDCCKAADPDNFDYLFNSESVDEQTIQSLQRQLQTFDVVSEAKGNHSDLWGNMNDGLEQSVVFGEFSMHERKLVDSFVYSPIIKSIRSRALYLMLSAYKDMQVHTRKTTKDGLNRCLKRITKNKPDEYILINLDFQFSLMFSSVSNRFVILDSYSWPEEVKESYLYDSLQGCLLVVEKKHRPFLTTDGNRPEVAYQNKSSLKDGSLDFIVTFNPHLVVKYSKNAVIYRIIAK